MRLVKLSEILDISMGKTPARKEKKYWGKGHKWVSIRDLNEKVITKTKEEITDSAINETRIKLVSKGTLLFSFKLTIGKMAFAGTDLYTNEAIAAFVIKDPNKLDSNYLYYALKSARLLGSNQAAMGKTLNSKSLAAIEVPVPDDINDQKRIAYLLGKVEALIIQRKQNIQQLDDLANSIFLDMFGDPVRNEKNWEYSALSSFGTISTGNTPPRKDPLNYSSNFVEWIKTDNILADQQIVSKATEYLSEIGAKKGRAVESGALLVACIAGSIDSIGRSALTDRTVAFNQQINAIQPFDNVHPIYLHNLFKISKSYIQSCASKGMKKIITKGEFEKIKLIKPPFELQKKFVSTSKKIENTKSKYQQSLNDLERLYGGLSQQAFKGELDLSRVPLPDENILDNTSVEELEKPTANNVENAILTLSPFDAAYLNNIALRKVQLSKWFNEWLKHFQKESDLNINLFWQSVSSTTQDYLDEDDNPFEVGLSDYDHIKNEIFNAIKSGIIEQTTNMIEVVDKVTGKKIVEPGNQILLKKRQ